MKKYAYDKIYANKFAIRYLRENSNWYKLLNRDANSVDKMIEQMKEKYGLRFKDKVEKAKTSLDLINAFMAVTKDN